MRSLRDGGRPRDPSVGSRSTARPLPPRASVPNAVGSGRSPVARKPRPDPGPLRIAVALTGIATASALISAFLAPSVDVNASTAATSTTVDAAPTDAVKHIVRYVQLQPGQTAPPNVIVQQAPAPKPRVVVVTTKQSGG